MTKDPIEPIFLVIDSSYASAKDRRRRKEPTEREREWVKSKGRKELWEKKRKHNIPWGFQSISIDTGRRFFSLTVFTLSLSFSELLLLRSTHRKYWVSPSDSPRQRGCSRCTRTLPHLRTSPTRCSRGILRPRTRSRTGQSGVCRFAEAEIHPAARKFAAWDYPRRCISEKPMDRSALSVR